MAQHRLLKNVDLPLPLTPLTSMHLYKAYLNDNGTKLVGNWFKDTKFKALNTGSLLGNS